MLAAVAQQGDTLKQCGTMSLVPEYDADSSSDDSSPDEGPQTNADDNPVVVLGRAGSPRHGNGVCGAKEFLPFTEALFMARSLGLASKKEWWAWCKQGTRPPNVPGNPRATYKNSGWQGWGHWLGTGIGAHTW